MHITSCFVLMYFHQSINAITISVCPKFLSLNLFVLCMFLDDKFKVEKKDPAKFHLWHVINMYLETLQLKLHSRKLLCDLQI